MSHIEPIGTDTTFSLKQIEGKPQGDATKRAGCERGCADCACMHNTVANHDNTNANGSTTDEA